MGRARAAFGWPAAVGIDMKDAHRHWRGAECADGMNASGVAGRLFATHGSIVNTFAVTTDRRAAGAQPCRVLQCASQRRGRRLRPIANPADAVYAAHRARARA